MSSDNFSAVVVHPLTICERNKSKNEIKNACME